MMNRKCGKARIGAVMLAALVVAAGYAVAQGKAAPSQSQVGVAVSGNLTRSQVALSLTGMSSPDTSAPAPAWVIRDSAGKAVASGKFQYG